MPTIEIGGATYEVEGNLAFAIGQERKDYENSINQYKQDAEMMCKKKKYKIGDEEKEYDDMDNLYKDMKAYMDGIMKKYSDMEHKEKTKNDSLTSQVELLENRLKEKPALSTVTPEMIKARVELHRNACFACDSLTEEKCYQMTDRQLKETVIGMDGLESKSDSSIDDMYELALKYRKDSNFESQKQATFKMDSSKTNTEALIAEQTKAYQDSLNTVKNSWARS